MSHKTALISAARTASVSSPLIKTEGATGCHVILDVTAVDLTPSITLSIEGFDPTSGKWYELLAGAPVNSISTTKYEVHPSVPSQANLVANDGLPSNIRVSVAHADADSITYSVGINFVN